MSSAKYSMNQGGYMNITLELKDTVYTTAQLPEITLPQIAMAGRSNVGKSSLINALAGRKKLAKVSATPGKTRSINFFLVEPYNFYLVDLPGYGYARASHEERRNWAKVLEAYLSGSGTLKGLALLLDSRLPPQRLDIDLAAFASDQGLPILPILTKIDKCSQRERAERQKEWEVILGARPLLVSSAHRAGLERVWRALIRLATGEDVNPEQENGKPT